MQVLKTLEEVVRLQPDWDMLFQDALDSAPFLSPEWLLAWWTSFSRPDWSMRFGVLRLDGQLIGVAPLMIRTETRLGRRCRVLRFWADHSSNRINFLVRKDRAEQVMEGIAAYLEQSADSWDLADLGPLVLADASTEMLLEALDRRGWSWGAEITYASPYRRLPPTWRELEDSLGSSFRSNLQRKLRRAERKGASFEVSRSASRMEDVFAISAETWQAAAGTGVVSTADSRAFYTRVAEVAEAQGTLRLAFLRVHGQPVAYELNLGSAGTLYNLKLGYRIPHRSLSPGLVLRRHVVAHAIHEGYREMDFLGMAEPYKMAWASGVRQHGFLVLPGRALSWRLVHAAWYKARPWLSQRATWLVRLKRVVLPGRASRK